MGAGDRRCAGRRGAAPQPGADPFSLGDADHLDILERAGFDRMRFEDVNQPVLYGHDLDAALAFVRGFPGTSAALARLSDRGQLVPSNACARRSRRTPTTSAAWSSMRVPG